MNILESITVWGLVAIAAFLSGRSLYRSFTGKKKSACSCGEASCPAGTSRKECGVNLQPPR